VIAQLLASEGFGTVEEIAYVDLPEIASIEGFDEDTANEIQTRAVEYLERRETELDEKRKELGVADDLSEMPGLDRGMLVALGERGVKTKLILETLEAAYHHKEQVPFDNLTIEHVMPQTINNSNWWQDHLGENWQTDHDLCLHTLGNLTLTAYNPELSNDPFPQKQQRFVQSHLELNHYFQNVPRWSRAEIEARSKALADLALNIWPYFGEDQSPRQDNTDEVTGRKPKFLTILGERISVESWRDVLTRTLSTIADLEPELFTTLAKEYPSFISLSVGRFRKSKQLNNGFYIYVNLSAKNIHRFCTQAIESIGLSKEDWIVETE
jgi:transcription termination factor NusA